MQGLVLQAVAEPALLGDVLDQGEGVERLSGAVPDQRDGDLAPDLVALAVLERFLHAEPFPLPVDEFGEEPVRHALRVDDLVQAGADQFADAASDQGGEGGVDLDDPVLGVDQGHPDDRVAEGGPEPGFAGQQGSQHPIGAAARRPRPAHRRPRPAARRVGPAVLRTGSLRPAPARAVGEWGRAGGAEQHLGLLQRPAGAEGGDGSRGRAEERRGEVAVVWCFLVPHARVVCVGPLVLARHGMLPSAADA